MDRCVWYHDDECDVTLFTNILEKPAASVFESKDVGRKFLENTSTLCKWKHSFLHSYVICF
jgi:hypothetical protein